MTEKNEITVQNTVSIAVDPKIATEEARNAGVYLLKLLDKKEKKVVINGKRHIEFEDWITLGNYYGLTVETGDAEPVEIFGAKGFKAKARVIRIEDGVVIGGAEAYCLNNERNWRNKDYFQLASMAQTRAGSKALSNELRWVTALSGIAGTPAEEMDGINGKSSSKPRPRPKPKGKVETITQDDGSELEPPKKARKEKKVVEVSKSALKEIFKLSPELKEKFQAIVDAGEPVPVPNLLREAQNLYAEGDMDLFKQIRGIIKEAK